MAITTFEPGDIVMLRSGGPLMVVSSARNDGLVACEWFAVDELRRDAFDPPNLEVISKMKVGALG